MNELIGVFSTLKDSLPTKTGTNLENYKAIFSLRQIESYQCRNVFIK